GIAHGFLNECIDGRLNLARRSLRRPYCIPGFVLKTWQALFRQCRDVWRENGTADLRDTKRADLRSVLYRRKKRKTRVDEQLNRTCHQIEQRRLGPTISHHRNGATGTAKQIDSRKMAGGAKRSDR